MIRPSGNSHPRRSLSGLTLIEIITVFLILIILGLMLFPVIKHFQSKSEKLNCVQNLKTLHTAANLYLGDYGHWPQIPFTGSGDTYHAKRWIETLSKYGPTQTNWICPTTQREAKSPDLSDPQNIRIDYFATTFDRRPTTPKKWVNQPWFIEKGAPHGKGNLIIYMDGRVEELLKVRMVN